MNLIDDSPLQANNAPHNFSIDQLDDILLTNLSHKYTQAWIGHHELKGNSDE